MTSVFMLVLAYGCLYCTMPEYLTMIKHTALREPYLWHLHCT